MHGHLRVHRLLPLQFYALIDNPLRHLPFMMSRAFATIFGCHLIGREELIGSGSHRRRSRTSNVCLFFAILLRLCDLSMSFASVAATIASI